DISNGTASFPAKVDSRIKYYTFAEYFNMPPDDQAEAYFAEKTANVAPARELGLAISPSPHSTYMVSDKLFKMSAGSERLSIHFMETATEMGHEARFSVLWVASGSLGGEFAERCTVALDPQYAMQTC
ncbi:MAG: hypothetical protein RR465_00795, partial [Mucinivorans sp.]